ncbi:MAG: hypothetical protein IJ769_04335, partial [Clostridia bacterium]|nr:hypothetical protein [Clostridia bacterium]
MKNNQKARRLPRALALALILALGLAAPAGAAGFWSWLTGGENAAVEAATEVTLPPAGALSGMDTAVPEEPITPVPEATVAATPAPIPAATIEDDGMLRV